MAKRSHCGNGVTGMGSQGMGSGLHCCHPSPTASRSRTSTSAAESHGPSLVHRISRRAASPHRALSYTSGMDVRTSVPLNADALLTTAQQGATGNAAEGWVQTLNQTAIQSQLTDYQARLRTHIDGQRATVETGPRRYVTPQIRTTSRIGDRHESRHQSCQERLSRPCCAQSGDRKSVV